MATRETKKKPERKTTLINGGTSPLTYTDDGRVLGAGERVELDTLDATARAAVDNGYLTEVHDSGDQEDNKGHGASDQD